MRPPVCTKRDYYRRWKEGEFGNKPHVWESLEALEASGYVGVVNIRSVVPGSVSLKFGVPVSKCRKALKGHRREEFRFNEPMPDHLIKIQGEVSEDHRGLCLSYSSQLTNLREAMQNAHHTFGLDAKMRLQAACDNASYEWIRFLLNEYQGHVVEFSVFKRDVGDRRLNTIIWEVRAY